MQLQPGRVLPDRRIVSVVLAVVVGLGFILTLLGPANAGPAECAPFGDRWFDQPTTSAGLEDGNPVGTDPNAIELFFLSGHAGALYAWSLIDDTLQVERIVITATNGNDVFNAPDLPTQIETPPNSKNIIFCFSEVPDPGIEVSKTSTSHPDTDGDGVADSAISAPGTVDYTLVATNTGNVELLGVTVTDPLLPGLTCSWPGSVGVLPEGAQVVCTGSLSVAQADIDAGGEIANTATAAGTGGSQGVDDTDTYVIPVLRDPSLSAVKTSTSHPDGDGDGAADVPISSPGTVDYTITATNDGNVTLTGVSVSDSLVPTLVCVPASPATLAPGATMSCTGSLSVDQADIDAGGDIVNIADATGIHDGRTVGDSDSYDIPVLRDPSLLVVKTSTSHPDGNGDGAADVPISSPGTIDYTITATNDGNVTLTSVSVSDSLVPTLVCVPASPATLAPGAAMSCTGSLSVDQADIDAGGDIINVASATGQHASLQVGDASLYAVPIEHDAELRISKTSTSHPDIDGDQRADTAITSPGTITYVFVVTNTGNVTINGVIVDDPSIASADCTTPTDLAPGATMSCTGTHDVTQGDIDTGQPVVNVARALGRTATGDEVIASDFFIVPVVTAPDLAVEKTSTSHPDADGDGVADTSLAGPAVVSYAITVTNTGNTTLSGILVDDPDIDAPGLVCTWPAADGALAPDDVATCTGSITVTQADFDIGTVPPLGSAPVAALVNQVTASVDETAASDVYIVPFERDPEITLTKASPTHPSILGGSVALLPISSAPTIIDYTIVATNTGNVTLDSVSITDTTLPSLSCDADTAVPPGETYTCTGSYAVTQADLDAGVPLLGSGPLVPAVTNIADVTALHPDSL
ncbi:MAG: hypothetical protein ABFR95_02395, partial [Actinomycetota bacterium]